MPPIKAYLTGPALLSSAATPMVPGTVPIIAAITNGRNGSVTTAASANQNPVLRSAVPIVKPSNLPKPLIITPNQIRNQNKNTDSSFPNNTMPTGAMNNFFTTKSTPSNAVISIPITTAVTATVAAVSNTTSSTVPNTSTNITASNVPSSITNVPNTSTIISAQLCVCLSVCLPICLTGCHIFTASLK